MKLKHIVANQKNIVFDIKLDDGKHKMMFGDVQQIKTATLPQTYNAESLQCNGKVIHNLYSSAQLFYKSAIYSKPKTDRHNNTYDFQNITLCKQQNELMNAVNVDNTMYAIAPMSEYGHYDIKEDIYDWIALSSNTQMLPTPNNIKTDIYDLDYLSSYYGTSDFDSLNAISVSFTDIKYNMIFEMPGSSYNDFYSGNCIANTFKGKNQYNSLYDMQHSDDAKLKNARQYCRVGACNNQLYLTYNDDQTYSDSTEELQNDRAMKYQKVEMLATVNRYAKLNGHKTGLYTIVVHNNILKHITNNESNKNIKNEIQNNVEKIAKKLQPAQTQLFNVVVIDD